MANWKTLLETALKGAKTAAPHILTGAKVAAPYVKSAVKTGAHAVKGTAEFVAKHPKTSLVAGAVSLPYFGYNKGALTFAKEKLLGDDSKEKGLVDTASRLAFGDQRMLTETKSQSRRKQSTFFLAKVPMIQSKEQEEPPSTRGRSSTIILKTVWQE